MTQNLKIRAYLMQHFIPFDMKIFSDPKTLTFGIWNLKTSLGQFGSKASGKGLIVTNKTSFSKESWDKSNKIMKSQKMSWPYVLGPRNCI